MGPSTGKSKSKMKLFTKKPSKLGRNRSQRFVKHSTLAKAARTLTGRTVVTAETELSTLPSGGILSCFLKDALDEENMKNPSKAYSNFYRAIFGMAQSQALLVHNLKKIAETFVVHLEHPDTVDPAAPYQQRKAEYLGIPSILRLVGVLARDLVPETLAEYFELLADACLKRINPSDVEVTTLAFQGVGKMLERCGSALLERDPSLSFQTKRYPTMLSHSSLLVRNLAAETFSYMIRRQSSLERKKHIWSILKAPHETYGEGIRSLLLFVVKGVQQRFHSNMPNVLSSAVRGIAKNKENKSIVEVRKNIFSWTEAMREYTQGVDDEVVVEVFIDCFNTADNTQDAAYIYKLATPWITCRKRNYEPLSGKVNEKLIKSLQSRLVSGASVETQESEAEEEAKHALFSFALDCWRSCTSTSNEMEDETEVHDYDAIMGPLLSAYLLGSGPANLQILYLEALEKLHFVSQFVPYILPTVSSHSSLKVWSKIATLSSALFVEDPEQWHRAFEIDQETRKAFSPISGRLSQHYVASPSEGGILLDRALSMLKNPSSTSSNKENIVEALEFLRVIQVDHVSNEALHATEVRKQKQSSPTSAISSSARVISELKSFLEAPIDRFLFGLAIRAMFAYATESLRDGHLDWLLQLVVSTLQNDSSFATVEALDTLYDILQDTGSSADLQRNAALVDAITRSLSSRDMEIRESSCRLMNLLFPQYETLSTLSSLHSLRPDFESERPRQILADSLAGLILQQTSSMDRVELRACLMGILGIYHVRFRPAWQVASNLLETLAKQQPDLVWELGLFDFFKEFAVFTPVEQERTSTSPEQVFTSFVSDCANGKDMPTVLKILKRNNKKWMFLFFKFLRDEYYPTKSSDDLMLQSVSSHELELGGGGMKPGHRLGRQNSDTEDLDNDEVEDENAVKGEDESRPSGNYCRKKLLLWLDLFASLTTLGSDLFERETLENIWIRLLLNEQTALSALKCLINVNRSKLESYRKTLEAIADVKTEGFRDALADLSADLSKSAESGNRETNELFILVSSRLLFCKLIQRPGRKERFSLAQRRRAIFSAFASLGEQDCERNLRPLFTLMLRPFQAAKPILETHGTAAEGFLSLLMDAIKVLGKRMLPFVKETTDAICALVEESCFGARLGEDGVQGEPNDTNSGEGNDTVHVKISTQARVRIECLDRLTESIEQFSPEFDFSQHFTTIIGPAMVRLSQFLPAPNENPSALLRLSCACMRFSPTLRKLYLEGFPSAFESLLHRIESSTNEEVLQIIFQCIESTIDQGDALLLVPFVSSFLQHISQRKTLRNPKELEILGKVARELIPVMTLPSNAVSGKKSSKPSSQKVKYEEMFQVCSKLISLLVEFVQVRPRGANEDNDVRGLTLDTIAAIARNLPPGELTKMKSTLLPRLARLFGPWAQGHEVRAKTARELLVQLYTLVNCASEGDEDDASAVSFENEILTKMNSWVQTRVDRECDFDKRLQAYHDCVAFVEQGAKNSADDPTMVIRVPIVLLNQALFDMQHADFALRTVAQTLATAIIRAISSLSEEDEHMVSVLSLGLRSSIRSAQDVTIRSGYLLIAREVVLMVNSASIPAVERQQQLALVERSGEVGKSDDDDEEEADEDIAKVAVDKENQFDYRRRLHGDMIDLINTTNPDLDFFLNSSHVQHSRRGRVLLRVAGQLDQGQITLSQETLKFLLIPIALHGVFLESASKGETGSGLALVASCAGKIDSFPVFAKLLESILRRTSRAANRSQARVLMRCACGVLDSFVNGHKDEESTLAKVKQRFLSKFMQSLIFQKDKEADEELNENVALSLIKLTQDSTERLDNVILQICGQLKRRKQSARDTARSALKKVSKYLGVKYFPIIFRHLTSTLNEGGYQIHVLGYTVYVLVEGLREGISGIPSSSSSDDASAANEKIEEKASKTIMEHEMETDVADGMDEEEAPEPQLAVTKDGRAFDEFRKTELDSVLDQLMKVLEDEMFGDNAPTEENGYKAKIHLRELRAGKSWDTLESLASCIAFLPCDSIHKLTRPFLDRLTSSAAALDPKVLNKCRDGFLRIRAGLMKNTDVRAEHLLIYVHNTLEAWVASRQAKTEQEQQHVGEAKSWLLTSSEHGNASDLSERTELGMVKGSAYASRLLYEKGSQLTGRSAERMAKLKNTNGEGGNAAAASAEHLFVEFALDLLYSYFFRSKNKKSALAGPTRFVDFKDMITPLVQVLVKEMITKESTSKRSIVLALRICNRILVEEQEETAEGAETSDTQKTQKALRIDLVRAVAHQALKFVKQNSVSSAIVSTDVSKASVEILTTLLGRDLNQRIFSTDDIKVLIRVSRLDLDDPNRLSASLRLLKHVFERKMLLPEMYDVALKLTQLIFQSDKQRERNRCSEIVCQFLLDFPLEEKRIQQQIDLVVKNLDFPHEDGRIAGLNMLRICIQKFPVELVDESAEFFFLPLVLRLVNDDAPSVKETCVLVVLALLRRVQQKKFQRLYEMALDWFSRENSLSAACQASGLFLETGRITSKPIVADIVEKLLKVVTDSLEAAVDHENPNWEVLYHSLISFEKLISRGQQAEHLTKLEDSQLVKLLVHHHAWIRLVSARILSRKLKYILSLTKSLSSSPVPTKSLIANGFDFVLASVDQLDADALSDELAEQITANFTDLIRLAKLQPRLFLKSNFPKENDISESESDHTDPIAWMAKRLSIVASRPERDSLEMKNRRRRAVFNIYLMICSEDGHFFNMDDENMLLAMLKAVTVLHVSDQTGAKNDPLRALCEEVMDSLKRLVGAERYVKALNDIRTVKQERKREKRKVQSLSKVLPLESLSEIAKRVKRQ